MSFKPNKETFDFRDRDKLVKKFGFDQIRLWIFKSGRLQYSEVLVGSPDVLRIPGRDLSLAPNAMVAHALGHDGPMDWSGSSDNSFPHSTDIKTAAIAEGLHDCVTVPIRLRGQLTHVWEISNSKPVGKKLDTETIVKISGTLFLISTELRSIASHERLDPVDITKRELEILEWFKQGKTYAEIGSILGLSKKTVDYHMNNIMRKLKVNDKLSAILKAARIGLIEI